MSESIFERLDGQDTSDLAQTLIAHLQSAGDPHRLLQARLLRHKHELGLPLFRPTSFADVPEHLKDDFENRYISEVQKLGHELLARHDIPAAWTYFRVLGEPAPVAKAIESLPVQGPASHETEDILQVAVYDHVAPVHGLKLMYHANGMCNTVTAFDQIYLQMTPDQRRDAAAWLVERIHEELTLGVRRHIEERIAMLPPDLPLTEMISNHPWIFEQGSYHTDISHLSSIIRFARSLPGDAPQIPLVYDLLAYGQHLSEDLHPHHEPPFENFFEAHERYFDVLSGRQMQAGLEYFRQQLGDDDPQVRSLAALVLIDLYARLKRYEDAAPLALEHLTDERIHGEAFLDFCIESKRYDLLAQYARQHDDPLLFAVARLAENSR